MKYSKKELLEMKVVARAYALRSMTPEDLYKIHSELNEVVKSAFTIAADFGNFSLLPTFELMKDIESLLYELENEGDYTDEGIYFDA